MLAAAVTQFEQCQPSECAAHPVHSVDSVHDCDASCRQTPDHAAVLHNWHAEALVHVLIAAPYLVSIHQQNQYELLIFSLSKSSKVTLHTVQQTLNAF